jgi:hypothetical protein
MVMWHQCLGLQANSAVAAIAVCGASQQIISIAADVLIN